VVPEMPWSKKRSLDKGIDDTVAEIDKAVAARMRATQLLAPDKDGANGDDLEDAYILARMLYGEYTIGIFGIDLIVGTEYEWQKACAEFWLGVAEGRGINIYLPPETALCKQLYRYGFQKEPSTGIIGSAELDRRNAEINQQKEGVLQKVYALKGVMDFLHAAKDKPSLDLGAELKHIEEEYAKGCALAQTLDGAQQENNHVRTVMQLRLRGGQVPLGNAA